jgi:hypothetical protein
MAVVETAVAVAAVVQPAADPRTRK